MTTPLLEDDTKKAIAGIPGDEGWWHFDGEGTYQELAAELIDLGMTADEAVTFLSTAFAAAAAEFGD